MKRNRPRRDLRELVRHIASETDFGYTRILGELRKLGIRRICRQTVKNILKEQGTDPRPKCGKGTWDEFLRIHAKTLSACDFFSKRATTKRGIVDLYAIGVKSTSIRVRSSSSRRRPDRTRNGLQNRPGTSWHMSLTEMIAHAICCVIVAESSLGNLMTL